MDFTGDKAERQDPYGHGTHVAGIIGGQDREAIRAWPRGRGW